MTATTSGPNSIPQFLGTNIPLVGNPYTLTKYAYTNLVRPSVAPVLPTITPYITKAADFVKPVTTPLLGHIGITEFKPLASDKKGNTVIAVGPEATQQTIIGGVASAEQEFDVFVARIVETARCLRVPDAFKKKEAQKEQQ
jgi:hypothetical protein